MNVVKKRKRKYTRRTYSRFANIATSLRSNEYSLFHRRCLENFKVEFHLFLKEWSYFFFLIREWNDRDHVISSSRFFRIRYLQPWTTLGGRGSFNSLRKTRSSFRKTKDFTRGDVKSVTVKNCLRFENATVIVQEAGETSRRRLLYRRLNYDTLSRVRNFEISRWLSREWKKKKEKKKLEYQFLPLSIGRELLFSCSSAKHGTISRNPLPFPRTQFVVIIVYSL